MSVNVYTFGEFFRRLLERGLEIFGLYYSVYPGKVSDRNDPVCQGRLKVSVPSVYREDVPDYWAYPCGFAAVGVQSGLFDIPAVGDSIWVMFQQGRPRYPIWMPGWYGAPKGKSEVPWNVKFDPPDVMTWRSKKGHRIEISNKAGDLHVTVIASDGAKIKFDVKKKCVELYAPAERKDTTKTNMSDFVFGSRTTHTAVNSNETVGMSSSLQAAAWTVNIMGAANIRSVGPLGLSSATMLLLAAPYIDINGSVAKTLLSAMANPANISQFTEGLASCCGGFANGVSACCGGYGPGCAKSLKSCCGAAAALVDKFTDAHLIDWANPAQVIANAANLGSMCEFVNNVDAGITSYFSDVTSKGVNGIINLASGINPAGTIENIMGAVEAIRAQANLSEYIDTAPLNDLFNMLDGGGLDTVRDAICNACDIKALGNMARDYLNDLTLHDLTQGYPFEFLMQQNLTLEGVTAALEALGSGARALSSDVLGLLHSIDLGQVSTDLSGLMAALKPVADDLDNGLEALRDEATCGGHCSRFRDDIMRIVFGEEGFRDFAAILEYLQTGVDLSKTVQAERV